FCQAEDGIRDRNVTGVQTCALPICFDLHSWEVPRKACEPMPLRKEPQVTTCRSPMVLVRKWLSTSRAIREIFSSGYWTRPFLSRSEERRVGKEGSCQWGRAQ